MSSLRCAWLTALCLALCPALGSALHAQEAAATLPARLTYVIARAANGHSPTPEEIAAAGTYDTPPSAEAVHAALPALDLALEHPDLPVRLFTLTALCGLATAGAADTQAAATTPSALPADTARALSPSIPGIAARLADDSTKVRLLAVQVLAGFAPAPPAAVYPPLTAFLRRNDAVGQVGLAVVSTLLSLAQPPPDAAAAIARYLRRSDQTSDARANLADSIATAPFQSPLVNQALLEYLNLDDAGVRARVILSLPALDLTPEAYADTHARVVAMAEGAQDSLPVVTAARQVAGCWTSVHMLSGCPVY